MDERGAPLQASQYPFLAAIDKLGPLTVGELAAAVGITQPGATRTVAQVVASACWRRHWRRTTGGRESCPFQMQGSGWSRRQSVTYGRA